jgi:hypothetical protein
VEDVRKYIDRHEGEHRFLGPGEVISYARKMGDD